MPLFFFCCKVKKNQQFIYEKSISCLFKDTNYIREQKANIRLPFELDLILDYGLLWNCGLCPYHSCAHIYYNDFITH